MSWELCVSCGEKKRVWSFIPRFMDNFLSCFITLTKYNFEGE